MRIQLSVVVTIAISSALGLGSAWGQNQQPAASQTAQKTPNWKDRAEYDLVQSALSEKDHPQRKLDLLNQWKDKYPETDFKETRLEAFIEAYQALKQPDKMLAAAKELMGVNPKHLKALYWIAMLTVPSQTSPDALDLAQKAANGLLNAEKPPQVTDQQAWEKTQAQMAVLGHRTLGWAYYQRKDYTNAETELKTALKANPNDSEAAYWLASALRARAAGEKKPDQDNKTVSKAATEFDFRQTRWGMSKEQVITSEGKPASDASDRLLYQTEVAGLKAAMVFEFVNNKLARAGYVLMEKYAEPNQYIIAGARWMDGLKEKYGEPKSDIQWLNDLYRNDQKMLGFAVSAGHLVIRNSWETERTKIQFAIVGSNFVVTVGVSYTSKELGPELDKKAKEAQKSVF